MNRYMILPLFLVLLVWGCESNTLSSLADDSGKQSDIEEARIALDNGSYDKVVQLLQDDYNSASPDPEIAGVLASAYMGKAGIDLTYVLENIGESDGGHFDTIASALSVTITEQGFPASAQLPESRALTGEPAAWYITASSIAGLLVSLENAQSILTDLVTFAEDQGLIPDDDAVVQLGMASALHFIMKTGSIVSHVMDSNVPVNRIAYQGVFPEDAAWTSLLEDTASYIDEHPDDLDSLKTDLVNLHEAVLALIENIGLDEDITEEFHGFILDLLGVSRGSSEQSVAAAINAYTGQDFAEFVYHNLLEYD